MINGTSILKENSQAQAGSFLYYLHEESCFHEKSFWDYYNSLIKIANYAEKNNSINPDVAVDIQKTFTAIMKFFIWHLHSKDSYVMNNFPDEALSSYIDRLETAVNACLTCTSVDESFFDDGLKE
ncbi:MAG: hypothetical protein JXR97_08910 [Planctomycetes bacterium]|nr:hypothetical protein [Planctomycetota bacterium]